MSIYESCNVIRQSLVKANLHYFMNESPHSIWITIRKKQLSPSNSQDSFEQVTHMKNLEFDQLKHNYQDLRRLYEIQAEDLKTALASVHDLKERVDLKSDEVEKERKVVQNVKLLLEETKDDLVFLKESHGTLENMYATNLEEIKTLQLKNRNLSSISLNFNKERSETILKHEKKVFEESRKYKLEVKYWKKQLGTERRKNLKLEKKLESSKLSADMKNMPSTCSGTCPSTNLTSSPTIQDSNHNLKYSRNTLKDHANSDSPLSTTLPATTTDSSVAASSIPSSNSTWQESFVCDRCGFSTKSGLIFKRHELIEERLNELNSTAREMLKNVPNDEQILTPEEVTTFGLDCREIEELVEFIQNVNKT